MILDIGKMQEYLDRENITAYYSKCGRLVGFDYNKSCIYNRDWDNLTMTARGLVFEVSTGNLVSYPWKKFFNYGEPEFGGIDGVPVGEDFIATEKADGSMIAAFVYDNEVWFMTRGSFYSDQAVWANEFAIQNYDMSQIKPNITYIFECIYPENRIVVDYGRTKELRLTGIRDLESGELLSYEEMEAFRDRFCCGIVKRFPFTSFTDVLGAREVLTMNEEGFVLRWKSLMCKVKGDEYMRIHRAISNISPLAFWENIDVPTFTMKIDFMEILPEEFRADCDELAAITVKIHQERLDSYWKIVKELPAFNLEEKDGKKNRYQHVVKHYPNDYGPVMGLLNSNNDRSVREIIHRAVRPTGNRYEGIEVSQSLSRFLKVMDEV